MFKKLWTYVVGAFALLLGLFFIERRKRLGAEAKADNAETLQKDAVLANDQKHLSDDIAKQEASIAEKVKQNENKPIENLSSSEVEAYWNKKRDS